jgi:glycosyltransferase involved in cell wall biosynthesis
VPANNRLRGVTANSPLPPTAAPRAGIELSVVIPIHNEIAILARTIDTMLAQLRPLTSSFEIVLVENGSTDGTARVARELAEHCPEVRVIALEAADYGAALRSGMAAAAGAAIVNFDLDYWDIPFLRDAWMLVQHRFDIIIGSKNLRLSSDGRSIGRRIVSQIFRICLNVVFRLRVTDTHGIKLWKNSAVLRQLMDRVRFDHHLFDTELILRAQRAGLRIAELPVEVVETRRSSWKLLNRIPRTLVDLIILRGLLWTEPRLRS